MTRTVVISDELATRLEKLGTEEGFASLDEAAEALIAEGLLYSGDDWDDEAAAAVRALIAEADASPAADWDAATFRAEVLRRSGAARRS
jgi:hypothetical protein